MKKRIALLRKSRRLLRNSSRLRDSVLPRREKRSSLKLRLRVLLKHRQRPELRKKFRLQLKLFHSQPQRRLQEAQNQRKRFSAYAELSLTAEQVLQRIKRYSGLRLQHTKLFNRSSELLHMTAM